MFQVALGGYYLNGTNYFDDSPIYYEPGYNIMSPLEIEVFKCDRFFILIRKRIDNKRFEELTASNLTATVKDATIGKTISSVLITNIIYPGWNKDPSDIIPVVLQIDNNISVRVRIIDCLISDNTDNQFISFRTIISDENKLFNYLTVYTNEIENRNSTTTATRQAYYKVKNNTDGYILFSPYAYLTETEKNDTDVLFSYPVESIYYKRQNTYNNEDFSFSIASYSDSFLSEYLSLLNVPKTQKVAVVHIDSYLFTKLTEINKNVYVDIEINGLLSEINDTFRIYFYK